MTRDQRIGSLRLSRLAIILGIVLLVNLVIFWIAASSNPMQIEGTNRGVSTAPVVLMTVIPFGLMGLLAWQLDRFSPWARPVMGWAGAVFALVSAISPLLMLTSTTSGAALALLHVLTGIGWLVALTPWRKDPETAAAR